MFLPYSGLDKLVEWFAHAKYVPRGLTDNRLDVPKFLMLLAFTVYFLGLIAIAMGAGGLITPVLPFEGDSQVATLYAAFAVLAWLALVFVIVDKPSLLIWASVGLLFGMVAILVSAWTREDRDIDEQRPLLGPNQQPANYGNIDEQPPLPAPDQQPANDGGIGDHRPYFVPDQHPTYDGGIDQQFPHPVPDQQPANDGGMDEQRPLHGPHQQPAN